VILVFNFYRHACINENFIIIFTPGNNCEKYLPKLFVTGASGVTFTLSNIYKAALICAEQE
jgi:hypothetical protein